MDEFKRFQELGHHFSTLREIPRNSLCLKTLTAHCGPGMKLIGPLQNTEHEETHVAGAQKMDYILMFSANLTSLKAL